MIVVVADGADVVLDEGVVPPLELSKLLAGSQLPAQ